MHTAATARNAVGTHIAVNNDDREATTPTTHDDGAVPSRCIVQMTRPCAATTSSGGARSSTDAAIGPWYQEMKNIVAMPAAYSPAPAGSKMHAHAHGSVIDMPMTIVHRRPDGVDRKSVV